MDVLHKILNWVDHNRYKVAGVLLPLILMVGMTACEPKAVGLKGDKVTPTEFRLEVIKGDKDMAAQIAEYEAAGIALQAAVDAYNAQITEVEGDFARQYELRKKVIDVVGGLATTLVSGGAVDLTQTIASLLAITAVTVGTGAVLDSRRKNLVINELKEKVTA